MAASNQPGGERLSVAADVDPADGDVPVYDAGRDLYVPGAPSGAGGAGIMVRRGPFHIAHDSPGVVGGIGQPGAPMWTPGVGEAILCIWAIVNEVFDSTDPRLFFDVGNGGVSEVGSLNVDRLAGVDSPWFVYTIPVDVVWIAPGTPVCASLADAATTGECDVYALVMVPPA